MSNRRRYGRDQFSAVTFAECRTATPWGLNYSYAQNRAAYKHARGLARFVRQEIEDERPVGRRAADMWRRVRTFRDVMRQAQECMRAQADDSVDRVRSLRHYFVGDENAAVPYRRYAEWLVTLAWHLNMEWRSRYGHDKNHKSWDVISAMVEQNLAGALPYMGLTPFAQAMPEQFKRNDPVASYRDYYKSKTFARWDHGPTPDWW